MPTVAGVDSSTQSTKVELRDALSGALLGRAMAPHPPTNPPRSEQDKQFYRHHDLIGSRAELLAGMGFDWLSINANASSSSACQSLLPSAFLKRGR